MFEVLQTSDPEVYELCRAEERRQADKIRLIPSENYVSKAVLEASGSVFTNKYSEGYPGKRYYEGQQYVDPLEQMTIDRAKALFGAAHANVQPYSGSPANLAVYLAFLKPGDKVMGLALPMGGHLTHGWSVSITGGTSPPCSTASEKTPAASTTTRSVTWPRRSAPRCCGPAAPPIRGYGTSRPWPRSPARWAPGSARTSLTSRAWWLAARTRRPCPTRTWSPPRRTKLSAGRAAAMILCRRRIRPGHRPGRVPGPAGGPHVHNTAALGRGVA